MKKVSDSTIERLSMYLHLLREMGTDGVTNVSSEELATRCGTSAAQVRKDLSFFGTFGKRGTGYAVAELITVLRGILGLERRWRVALVGAGKIGAALLAYQDFARQGFDIVAVFDIDPKKIGTKWNGIMIQPDAELEATLRGAIDIAIVAVPAESAQAVVNRITSAGVRAILNFAPTKLNVPDTVAVKTVNMAMELEGLSYALVNDTHGGRAANTRPASSAAMRDTHG